MSHFPDHDVQPFDTGPLLWWVLGLLGLALLLEFYVAVPWTQPFSEPSTWILIGVFVGFGLRLGGQKLDPDTSASKGLRWASFLIWSLSAVGGLLIWLM